MTSKKYTLFPHQKTGSDWLVSNENEHKGGILADEMGLGKTIQMIDLMLRNRFPLTLIVAPASLVQQWHNEILNFTEDIDTFVNPSMDEILTIDKKKLNVFIVSYNYINRPRFITKIKYNRIICDEAHYFRNPKSKTFNSLQSIKASNKWAITGTPIQNYVKDIKTLFKFIRADPESDIKHLISKHLLRRTVQELDFKLPSISKQLVFIGTHNQKLSERITKDEGMHHLEKILRLKQACVVPGQTAESITKKYKITKPFSKLQTLKLNKIKTDILSSDTATKIIVFTFFKREISYLTKELSGKVKCASISGKTPSKLRDEIVKDKTIKVLFIQIMAGGTGLNLQHYNTIYFSGPQWNPTTEQQAIARVYRIGQTHNVNIKRYITGKIHQKTIEKRILRIQNKKLVIIAKYLK